MSTRPIDWDAVYQSEKTINYRKNQKAILSPKLKYKCATDQEADVSPQPEKKDVSTSLEADIDSKK